MAHCLCSSSLHSACETRKRPLKKLLVMKCQPHRIATQSESRPSLMTSEHLRLQLKLGSAKTERVKVLEGTFRFTFLEFGDTLSTTRIPTQCLHFMSPDYQNFYLTSSMAGKTEVLDHVSLGVVAGCEEASLGEMRASFRFFWPL